MGTAPALQARDRLVLYDASGKDEPRVLYPTDASSVKIGFAAAWENANGALRLLISSSANTDGSNPNFLQRYVFSADGGSHWTAVGVPGAELPFKALPDYGGALVRGNNAQVRLGTRDFPFVVAVGPGGISRGGVFAVGSDGSVRVLYDGPARLLGSDIAGERFLVQSFSNYESGPIFVLDLKGNKIVVTAAPTLPSLQGWITPGGAVYLLDTSPEVRRLSLWTGSLPIPVAAALPGSGPKDFFAVPTADGSGAWVVQRKAGSPTVLSLHSPESGLVEQWRDATGPQIEALHVAASGRRLLVQVRRDRPKVPLQFVTDPALAIWEIGTPPPADYHELFLNEGSLPGFDHLDVDAAAAGATFVFDSGSLSTLLGGVSPSGGGGGGSDVLGEEGHVRSSFRQRLVVPLVTRVEGRAGTWTTELVLRNPSTRPTTVFLLYTASGSSAVTAHAKVELAPREIRGIPDAVSLLFGLDRGTGALTLTSSSDDGIEVTSYLSVLSPRGRYGTAVMVSDTSVASGVRFPWSFSAGLPGQGQQATLVAVDSAGEGVQINLIGASSSTPLPIAVPPAGQLEAPLDALASQGPSLRFQPMTGHSVAGVLSVDDLSSDPLWFSADLSPGPSLRGVPAVIHTDGLAGTQWRTDLYLFNPSPFDSDVTLGVKNWQLEEGETLRRVTVKAGESRRISDALFTLFGKTGVARLRFSTDNVRLTTRIWSAASEGGTIGLTMPPCNSFQSAGVGESLEILVPISPRSQVSLALVDFANPDPETATNRGRHPGPPTRSVAISLEDGGGATLSFSVAVPQAGGLQIADLFREHPVRPQASAVLIRVSPPSGLVAAFATLVQDGTHDPAYFPAWLAAH